jgi:Tol biopolymer transport system component
MTRIVTIWVVASISVFAFASQPPPVDRVNVGVGGQTNGYTYTRGANRGISASGRFVAFLSWADNLVLGDTNQTADIFLKDTYNGKIDRVNVDNFGSQMPAGTSADDPAISGDGSVVAFISTAALVANMFPNTWEVFVRDLKTQHTELVSINNTLPFQANATCSGPVLNYDGTVVVYWSSAFNLVANDTNGRFDVFAYDRPTGVTERISLDSTGNQSNGTSSVPSVSADGRFVVFQSDATNLVPNDTNGVFDIFLRDRAFGTTVRVSTDSVGNEANGPSANAMISSDGNWVVFESVASNLVSNDLNGNIDVFIKNLITGATEMLSVGPFGQGNFGSASPVVTQHGRYVIFDSGATNLVANDTNNMSDSFVKDRVTGTVSRLNEGPNGLQANGLTGSRGTDAVGLHVLFDSGASNLVANDTNNNYDVFVRNRKHDAGFIPDR